VSFSPHPEIPGEGLSRENEFELEQRAEHYSQLHGDENETERPAGLIKRIVSRLRRIAVPIP
jgi:hypothetical protein